MSETYTYESTSELQTEVEPAEEQIAALAYNLWEQRNRPEGSADHDWFAAKNMLSSNR